MSPQVFLLIALLKTVGEGGTVQIEYATEADCNAAGARLEQQYEAIDLMRDDGKVVHPKVIWTCFEAPEMN